MYRISVPITLEALRHSDREALLGELNRLDAERIFLVMDRNDTKSEKRQAALSDLRGACAWLKENGYEVGVWIFTFTFGKEHALTPMTMVNERLIECETCPADPRYVSLMSDYVRDLATCGVDLIMLDDDLRYGFFAGEMGCLCKEHISRINGRLGEAHTREALVAKILDGGKNRYRDAWLTENGRAMEELAYSLRAAVNEVDPKIRLGACACLSSWDIDGTDAARLARIFAGDTKPFVRLIGAPYWAERRSWGNRLQDTVELERMESAWTRNADIEILAEGDCYPRPRTACPAAYLEGFDLAIRASNVTDGILKYGIDYVSSPAYETGYASRHMRNRPLYRGIDRMLRNKTAVGIRVYEYAKKTADAHLSPAPRLERKVQHMFFSIAARTLACHAIPTVYKGDGICGIVFGENARHLPLDALSGGLILDAVAARILTERGVDVGIVGACEAVPSTVEHYLEPDEYCRTGNTVFSVPVLSEHAVAESVIPTENGDKIASYLYENDKKQRFFVLNFEATTDTCDEILRHYARGRQYQKAVKWFTGRDLPAYAYGNPDLYLMAKRTDDALAVGLWNFSVDEITEPRIELEKRPRAIEFLNCTGRIEGTAVILSTLSPYGFAAFEVRD